MMNSIITLTLILLAAVGFTCAFPNDIIDYEPLRCFVCTGPLAPLCDGDDTQQYGVRDVKCNDDLPDAGQIVEKELGNSLKDLNDDNIGDTAIFLKALEENITIMNDPDRKDIVDLQDQEERAGKPIMFQHDGQKILVKDGRRCWIMKVEYTAHGLIEVYKGCHRNIGDEFTRNWNHAVLSRSIPVGYCKSYKSPELVGPDYGRRYYYSHVTVCFCSTHNCNEKTLPHFEENGTMVGLEDVEQRRWLKKRKGKKRKNSSETLNKSQRVTVALLTIFGLALAVYLIRG